MNKRGFTLVELLAVVIILSIILVIAVPNMNKAIAAGKENAFKTNVDSIIKLTKTHYQENYGSSLSNTNIVYNITNNKIMRNSVDLKLSSKTGNINGTVEFNSSGNIKVILQDSVYCGLKNFNNSLEVHSLSNNSNCSI